MNQSKEQHRLRNRIILALIILALIGCFGFLRWNTRVHFYKDEGTTGNTSTNLLNGGLFAKSGDTIYFANPYDQNSLYSMDTGLKHIKKVYNDYTSYINAAGDYVFYTRSELNGIYAQYPQVLGPIPRLCFPSAPQDFTVSIPTVRD